MAVYHDRMATLSDAEFTSRTNHFVGGYAGASRNVHTNAAHEIGDPGFIVGIKSPYEKTVRKRDVTATDVAKHQTRMRADPSVQAAPAAVQGSWGRGPEGAVPLKHRTTTFDRSVHIDTGNHTQDLEHSIMMGRDEKQKAIFNLRDGEDIKVNKPNVATARINAASAPDRPSSHRKPNPLFGE